MPAAVTTRRAVISLRVSVPVLSEQITEVAPSVSTMRQPAHDGVARGHPAHADGQGDGDDRRRPSGTTLTASATTTISASSQA